MVERPIKKSERQVSAEASSVTDNVSKLSRVEEGQQDLEVDSQSGEERSPKRQDRNKGRQGRGGRQKAKETSQVNPALLRGPKPTKPKPPTIHEEQATPVEPLVPATEQVTSTES